MQVVDRLIGVGLRSRRQILDLPRINASKLQRVLEFIGGVRSLDRFWDVGSEGRTKTADSRADRAETELPDRLKSSPHEEVAPVTSTLPNSFAISLFIPLKDGTTLSHALPRSAPASATGLHPL